MIIDGKNVKADEGMILTDGNSVYASFLRLGDFDSADNYYEVTKEEYESILQAQTEEFKLV